MTTLGQKVFYNSQLLESISLHDNVTDIGNEAFGSFSVLPCSDSANSLLVPSDLSTAVYTNVAFNCTITIIGKYAFEDKFNNIFLIHFFPTYQKYQQ